MTNVKMKFYEYNNKCKYYILFHIINLFQFHYTFLMHTTL
jgi:hypothetical protein